MGTPRARAVFSRALACAIAFAPAFGVGLVFSACSTSARTDAASDAAADGTPDTMPLWTCPAHWVRAAGGGCGPAVLLCVPDGGAGPSACVGNDPFAAGAIALPDGGVVDRLRRTPDGGFAGAWREPGQSEGPPARASIGTRGGVGIADCPAGWVRANDGTCDSSLATTCAGARGRLPGGTCVAVGDGDCPAGEFPTPDPGAPGRAAHVRAGADPVGADGSPTRPYASIAAALRDVGAGGWVLLAAGEYTETLNVTSDLHVRGVCAARVTLRPAVADGTAVHANGPLAVLDLRGVTVRVSRDVVRVAGGARADLRRVRVTGAIGRAVSVVGAGSRLDAQDLVIYDARGASASVHARGLSIEQGARAVLSRAWLGDIESASVVVEDVGSRLEATDVSIERGRVRSDGRAAGHFIAQDGGNARCERCVILDARAVGVVANGGDASVELLDVVVRGTRSHATGTAGVGMVAQNRARITGARVLIDDNLEAGVAAQGAGAQLELRQSVVRGTRPSAMTVSGLGLLIRDGAAANLSNVLVTDNTVMGAQVSGTASALLMTDTMIERTRLVGADRGGWGLSLINAATATLSRCTVADVAIVGIAVAEQSRLDADRIAVMGVRSVSRELGTAESVGRAVVAQTASSVSLRRSLLSDCAGGGLAVMSPDTRATFVDSAVRGISTGHDGIDAAGVLVSDRAALDVERVLVDRVEESAVGASGTSRGRWQDLVVFDTRRSTRGYGVAVTAWYNAHVDLERVAIDGAMGFAFGAIPRFAGGAGETGATLTGIDVFVRNVRASEIQRTEDNLRPSGNAVAYGMHVATDCSISLTRARFAAGGYGFFSAEGTLRLHDAVVSQQLDALGAVSRSNTSTVDLVNITAIDNATNDVVERALPSASALQAPTAVCLDGPC